MKWILLLVPLSSLHAATSYNVVSLGGYGGNASVAAAVNASGVAAGTSTTARGTSIAFASSETQPVSLAGAAEASDINGSGAVAGTAYIGGTPRAVVWKDGVTTQVLSSESYGLGINDSGEIAGARRNGSRLTGFVATSDGVLDVPGSASWSSANDINNAGVIAGTLENATGQFRAFSWDRKGSAQELGTLGGANSYGMAVSDSGLVAGSAQTGAGYLHAFLYEGSVRDLGTLGGNNSAAYDVNAMGQVVGYSFDVLGRSRAFVWFNGMMFDLNELVNPDSGWTLDAAYGINDAGQIVGSGVWNGQAKAFRLDPLEALSTARSVASLSDSPSAAAAVPEPAAMALTGFGTLGLLLLKIRRIQQQPKGWRSGRHPF